MPKLAKLTFLVTSISVLSVLFLGSWGRNQISDCVKDVASITFGKSTTIRQTDSSSVEITVTLTLQEAEGPRTFLPQYFLDGIQILVDEPAISLNCGETKVVKNIIPVEDAANLIVFFRQLPIIPPSYSGKTAEDVLNDSKGPSAAWDFADFETVFIGEAPEFNEAKFSNIEHQFIKSPGRISYLFTWPNKEEQKLVTNLNEDSYDFGLFFGEPSDNPNEIFSFTCMLDDIQINAFNGNSVWSGKIPSEHGVVIRGNVEISEEGWHQLRCVSLNSMYANADEINYYPYTILSTYIFKSNAPN